MWLQSGVQWESCEEESEEKKGRAVPEVGKGKQGQEVTGHCWTAGGNRGSKTLYEPPGVVSRSAECVTTTSVLCRPPPWWGGGSFARVGAWT